MTTADKLFLLRKKSKLTLDEVARELNTTNQCIYKYEKGIVTNIPINKIEQLASLYHVSPSYLIGWDNESEIEIVPPNNVYMVPVYESASAGYGTDAIDTVVEYSPAYCQSKAEADETMVIRVRGNSMAPKIEDGDMLQVWRTPYAESGSICVVTVDTDHGQDGFVKRIRYGTGYVELQSLNDGYDPVRFTGADAAKLKIVGVVRRITKIC